MREFSVGAGNFFFIRWRLNTDLFGTQLWHWMKVIAAIIKPSYSFSSHGKLVQSKRLFHELLRLEQKVCQEWVLVWRKHLLSPLAAEQRLCSKIYSARHVCFPAHRTWNLWLALIYCIFLPSAFQPEKTMYPIRESNLSYLFNRKTTSQWRKPSSSM